MLQEITMILESTFSNGDRVWTYDCTSHVVKIPCPVCKGKGKVTVNDIEMRCSYAAGTTFCLGGEIVLHYKTKYFPKGPLTIGFVRVETTGKTSRARVDEQYMCKETGIGSGTTYRPGIHIFSTKKEAQEMCDTLFAKSLRGDDVSH